MNRQDEQAIIEAIEVIAYRYMLDNKQHRSSIGNALNLLADELRARIPEPPTFT